MKAQTGNINIIFFELLVLFFQEKSTEGTFNAKHST
jgi:hypothetical protein